MGKGPKVGMEGRPVQLEHSTRKKCGSRKAWMAGQGFGDPAGALGVGPLCTGKTQKGLRQLFSHSVAMAASGEENWEIR